MATPTFQMLWLTIVFAGLAVLVAGGEMNKTSTASPKVKEVSTETITKTISSTTQPPPPFAAVMDIFQAPLAAFKPKMDDKVDMPMGRDDSNTGATSAPSNIFFRAGNGLGSAASSLTGWFNNRMIPQALRPSSSTTAAPEVIAIIPSQQIRRKVLGNRQRPVQDDSDDVMEEDAEEEVNDDNDGNDDENNFNSNIEIIEDDDEDDYESGGKRKGSMQTRKRPNRQYFYIEEELAENDDFEYDVQPPARKNQRKQQNLANKRRKNPPKKKQQKRRKPVRKVQNPQTVQYVQNRPSQMQVKRKRRPTATFELVPISPNQAMNTVQKKKPTSSTQNNQQRPVVSQFLSIPWSRLGFAGPPKEPTSNEQQPKPIIVRIPQQNIKRKRRPTKKPAKAVAHPKRKPLRGPLQNQSPVFSILNEDQIREIFKAQLNQPPKTSPHQASNLPVTLDTRPNEASEEVSSSNNSDIKPAEKPQAELEGENHDDDTNAFIVVGPADDEDDKEIDLNLYRHYNNRRGFKGGRSSPRLSHHEWEMDDDYDE